MNSQEIIRKLVLHKADLTHEEAKTVFNDIVTNNLTTEEIAGFCCALAVKGETVVEMIAFIEEAMSHAVPVNTPDDKKVVDIVGTGGDGGSTFNISSASAILMSACGAVVAKHGNKAVTGTTGSADAMTLLGLSARMNPRSNERMLAEFGLTFLNAPSFHPSFANVAKTRAGLKVPTFFNILGPLLNPAKVKRIVLGTPFAERTELIADVLLEQKYEHAVVLRSQDGLDEVSPTAPCDLIFIENGEKRKEVVTPEDLGFKRCELKELQVATKEQSVEIIKEVLTNKRHDSCFDTVLMNTGLGLYIAGMVESWQKGIELARQTIEKGEIEFTMQKIKKFIAQHKL